MIRFLIGGALIFAAGIFTLFQGYNRAPFRETAAPHAHEAPAHPGGGAAPEAGR
jgi:hypothetical protein